jgi:hypothetical protein
MLLAAKDLLGCASKKRRIAMKRILLVVAALFLSAIAAFATATTQKWTAGWDNLSEPLNYKKSYVSWSVNPTTSKLSVTFKLVSATPNKLYQVGVNIFCTTFPATFGQFPTWTPDPDGTCPSITRQGVPEAVVAVELGVVTTDINGDGSFTVVVGPIAAGTYDLEFQVRNGAGCNLTGGAGNKDCDCEVDFQPPGPKFGDEITITIP